MHREDRAIESIDKKVISLIQGDTPLDPRPFAVMARKIGISEEEFIERVKTLKGRGIIRRFGATLRHQEAGYGANAMVAWSVPEGRIEEVGKRLAGFREVTHCYEREAQAEWHYNLYTMVHGETRNQCRRAAEKMSQAAGIREYLILFSEKELKKTSMQYF